MTTKRPAAKKHFDDLRKRAENAASGKAVSKGETSADIQKLIHELNVHQIELEMQNEELRRSQTETKETKEEQSKYADLYDFAPVGYFTFDKKACIVQTNVIGASLLGAEKRSLTGQPFRRFITPGHFSIFQSHLQKAHESRSKEICKLKLARKDGSLFDALIDTIVVIHGEGKFDHYRSAVTDITEITRAEALRESEIKYRGLYESTQDGIAMTDIKGTIVECNRAYSDMLGYTQEEIKGITYQQTTPVQWHEMERNIVINKILKTGYSDIYEKEYIKKDGIVFPVSMRVWAIKDEVGNKTGMWGIIRDITELKKAERAIKLNESRLESLLKISQYKSASIHDLLDFALDEAVSLTESKIGHIYFYDDEKREFQLNTWSKDVMNECTIAEQQTIYQLEKTGIWGEAVRQSRPIMVNDYHAPNPLKKGYPEGHALLHKYLTIPVFSAERIVAVVGVANKQTDYDEGDVRQLTLLMDSVWKIVEGKQTEMDIKERTQQLEYANKELESFSYSVSHDLRAPLRAIDGYARLILKRQGDKFDQDTLDKFNVIRSSTHLMGQLIDDLLTFSRLGRKPMSSALLDMELLTKDAWKELQASDPETYIKPTVESMPPCHGDRTLIKQVLINLLSNAVKFTKYQDVAEIVVGGYADGNEHVYYIRDNGVGFDMTYYDKLFGVFQRLHSTDQFEGTGVGLATVQRIILRHGGRVWAEGKVDEGACFYFALNMKE